MTDDRVREIAGRNKQKRNELAILRKAKRKINEDTRWNENRDGAFAAIKIVDQMMKEIQEQT